MWDHKIRQVRISLPSSFPKSTKYNDMPFDAAEATNLRNSLSERTTYNKE